MVEAQSISQQLFEHLRDKPPDDLTQLNRGVQLSQSASHKSLFDSNDQFEAAFQKFQDLRTQLQRLAKDLRSHEAAMKEDN